MLYISMSCRRRRRMAEHFIPSKHVHWHASCWALWVAALAYCWLQEGGACWPSCSPPLSPDNDRPPRLSPTRLDPIPQLPSLLPDRPPPPKGPGNSSGCGGAAIPSPAPADRISLPRVTCDSSPPVDEDDSVASPPPPTKGNMPKPMPCWDLAFSFARR